MKFTPNIYDIDRPATAVDYKGDAQPIKYPAGNTLARCGVVFLVQTGKSIYGFAVVYGLQTKEKLTRQDAVSEFGNCCIHQAECDGLVL